MTRFSGISLPSVPSLLKFYFGEHVTCYVDDKRRQSPAAKRVDPLGKMQLPFREGCYLGPATDLLTYSLRTKGILQNLHGVERFVFPRTGIARLDTRSGSGEFFV